MLIYNMIKGVSNGFKKKLELIGVGFRANINNNQILNLNIGYSHNIMIKLPQSITLEVKMEKNTQIILKSYDKQLLGIVAAKIRSLRKPEPYKGKGIRYINEYVIKKPGKSAK